MSEREMQPCPFERGTCDPDTLRTVIVTDRAKRPNVFRGYVECEDCGARGPSGWAVGGDETRQLAIHSWNDRTPSPTKEE